MKRHAPAAARNRDPICEVLREVLPSAGVVLEIASGTGEHVVHFAAAMPDLDWQPSDVGEASLASIATHREDAGLDNVREPRRLDVRDDDWGVESLSAIVCINMIHIAPWACCEGLMRGAGRCLRPGGVLVTYGPYRFDGAFTAPSNETFDASLRHQDPSWGVRDLTDVTRLAEESGLARSRVVDMPANNHVIVFTRQ